MRDALQTGTPASARDGNDLGRARFESLLFRTAHRALRITHCAVRAPRTTHNAHRLFSMRLGLCCQFLDAPIRFRQATHRYVGSLAPEQRWAYLSQVARANAIALAHAVERCAELGIGAFRVNSQLLPLATHPESGYTLDDLHQGDVITASFRAAGELARLRQVRLSFHPDQFVVLNSERPHTVESSVRELEHTAAVSALIGADTITVHGGGGAGGAAAALDRLRRGMDRLSDSARSRLALENDDRVFTPAQLLPVCDAASVPLVYDVHHHRCNADDLSVEAATDAAVATWRSREPWMHISSPRDGWTARDPRPHADYVNPTDLPDSWRGREITVDVEAKAKERAVLALLHEVRSPRSDRRSAVGAAAPIVP